MTGQNGEVPPGRVVGEVITGAGVGLTVDLVIEEMIGDGPVTRAADRREEVQASGVNNRQFFPYDAALEIGGSMVMGALVAVAIGKKLRGR